LLYFFVRELKDSLQDRIRPGLLFIKAFMARDKEPGHYPRCISRDMDRRTSDERRSEH